MSAARNTALVERRSIRKYLPEPVSDDMVREILTEARWAPSATNTQSTYVYVLEGETLKRLKAELRTYAESEVPPKPDLELTRDWPPVFAARMQDLFKTRSAFIAAEEAKAGVQPQAPVSPMVAGAELFGAPVVLILAQDKVISVPYGCFDAACFAMSITLAAHARGLGTCIAASPIRFGDMLRKLVPGTDDKTFVIGIALGVPDMGAPLNRFPRTRAAVDEYTTFYK